LKWENYFNYIYPVLNIRIMKTTSLFLFSLFLFLSCSEQPGKIATGTREVPIDKGWHFICDSTISASDPLYDDSKWRLVDLPHDWSIEDLPGQNDSSIIGPFSKTATGGTATGFTVGGTGWYRKEFTLGQDQSGKQIYIHFDGVYMLCDVWVNGRQAGSHHYGYTPFYFNITPLLNAPDNKNVIAVQVRNTGKNSRWYSGSGIYRHVWLTITNPTHIAPWSIFITTPEVSGDSARIKIETQKIIAENNQPNLIIRSSVIDPSGQIISVTESAVTKNDNQEWSSQQFISILKPKLWSPEKTFLYKAHIKLISGQMIVDSMTIPFGIRSIQFSAEKGFLLNGQPVKLKGGCMHHDNGLLGSATFDRAEIRRIKLLKANGFNALRTSHNPPSKQLLDACDSIGILVLDEAFDMWEHPKNPQDYSLYFKQDWKNDLGSYILRDRNHPSVIIWSIGNEIYERSDTSGVRIAEQLANYVKSIDRTRPVTAAVCEAWDHPGRTWDVIQPAFKYLDVCGYNYHMNYEKDHKEFPQRIMMGTESVAQQNKENWDHEMNDPWVIGDFVWTAMDYLGEVGCGHARINVKVDQFGMSWPWTNAWCGDIDICGDKKMQSYYRDVIWNRSLLEMNVHTPMPEGSTETINFWGWPDVIQSWTFPGNENKKMQVYVYSSCQSVKLFLNDKLIQEKQITLKDQYKISFDVPYQPGTIKAIGFIDGKEMAVKSLTTVDSAYKIVLVAERNAVDADRNDLAYIHAEIRDKNDHLIPDAVKKLDFSISGEGEWLAAGNASPDQPASFKGKSCKTFRGKCLIIIRPFEKTGKINITAKSQGLEPGSAEISVK
jgi:beta-galactosidase